MEYTAKRQVKYFLKLKGDVKMGFLNRFRRNEPEEKQINIVVVRKTETFKYLHELIKSAKGEVNLDADIIMENREKYAYPDGIEIYKDLTINGNGHTIDAGGLRRIFDCHSHNITLKNIIFKQGFTKESGGAIKTFGNLNVEGCIFAGNVSQSEGGAAIHSYGGKVTLKSSGFVDNVAVGDFCFGGAVHASGDLNIIDCEFKSNLIIGEHGNGAGVRSSGVLKVENSKFYNNMIIGTYADGGAIYTSGKNGQITGCEFKENIAKSDGGAIYNQKRIRVENSTFENNMSERHQNISNYFNYDDTNTYENLKYDKNRVNLIFHMVLESIKK